MGNQLRVLVVEDQQSDIQPLKDVLRQAGVDIELLWARTQEEFDRLLGAGFDFILAECCLSWFDPTQALEELRITQLEIPFIILTDPAHEETAVNLVQQGAADYIFKDRLSRLTVTAGRLIREKNIREAIDRAEQDLWEGERRYRQIVEEAGDVVYLIDLDGYFTYVNPPSQRLTGYSNEELVGMHFNLLLPGAWERKIITFYLDQIESNNQITKLEFPIITATGEEKWVEQTTVLLTEGDEAVGFQSIVRDITTRKEAEEALKAQRNFAEALARTAAVLNKSLDLDVVLDHILERVRRVVPHDVADIMLVEDDLIRIVRKYGYEKFGIKDEDVFEIHLPLAGIPNLAHMAETQRPLVIPDVSKFPNWVDLSATRWILSYVGAPILVGDVVIGFLNLNSASTEFFTEAHAEQLLAFADQVGVAIQNARLFEIARRQNEELEAMVAERTAELQAANKHLHALTQVKDEFVSNVSHELRTPITNIKLYHDLLAKKPERTESYIAVLKRETERLEKIVEDLLYLSRLDQKAFEFSIKPFDLATLAEQCVNDRAYLAQNRNLELAIENGDRPGMIQGDKVQLGIVLSILLTNALNYTPPGGRVTVRTLKETVEGRPWVTLSVQDTGPGVPLEEQKDLFKRFFRGQVGRNSGAPGTGLGLSIAQEIVEQHNGRIEVKSQGISNQGSTFTVWLPLNQA